MERYLPPFLSFKIITKKARESKLQMKEKQWGGKREGAGRPKGKTVAGERKGRNIRAFDDEWELIKQFAKIVKTDRQRAEELLKLL
nr:MAG TPA: hypothetical protein [Caudoviricetes sp.]DAP78677.1 MAG TPA: hypothetical protein [Caudoviricetes sp.]